LRCDSITPFGVPVLPLEKITVARLSGLPSPTMNSHSMMCAGSRSPAIYMPNV
jgi:hypothetical protein